jgi:hypothetical protein
VSDDWAADEAKRFREGAWPVLDPAGLYGPLGAVVDELAPETEADRAALLLSLIASFGSAVPQPHVRISAIDHHARINVIVVGNTFDGGKGESWSTIEGVMRHAAPDWVRDSVVGGFASGEGLIANLAADAAGPSRLVVEREFAALLARAQREGSILSPVLRAAYDGDPLENRRAGTSVVARNHHIGVVGHITPNELRRNLRSSEISNGFANRFLFALVRRSQVLPFGGSLPQSRIAALGGEIAGVIEKARSLSRLDFSRDAKFVWSDFVDEVTRRQSLGLVGDLTARARPHTLRLALVYAAADGSSVIDAEHVQAAIGVWRFSDASVRVIFDSATGDPLADRLLVALKMAGDRELSLSEQRSHLGHNYPAADLRAAGAILVALGLVERIRRPGKGRPAEALRLTGGVKESLDEVDW